MNEIAKLINEVVDYARQRNDIIIKEIILEYKPVHSMEGFSLTSGTETIDPKIFEANIKPFLKIGLAELM